MLLFPTKMTEKCRVQSGVVIHLVQSYKKPLPAGNQVSTKHPKIMNEGKYLTIQSNKKNKKQDSANTTLIT